MASPHRSKNKDQEGQRYPKRARKERTFFLEQREISKGLLEFQMDEGRGLEQPDSLKLTPAQILDKQLRKKGTELFWEYLSPRGWKWVTRVGGFTGDYRSGEYVWRAPGVTKSEEAVGINMFPSYQAIAEQYERDGQTVDRILARVKPQPIIQSVNEEVKLEEDDSSDDDEEKVPPPQAPNPRANGEESSSSIQPDVNVKFQGDGSSDEDEEAPPPQAPNPLAGESSAHHPVPVKVEDDAISVALMQGQGQVLPDKSSSSFTFSIRERLSRIEDAVGGYSSALPNQDANNKSNNNRPLFQRIGKLEEDCGVTLAPPLSLVDRVSNLERAIGLPPL